MIKLRRIEVFYAVSVALEQLESRLRMKLPEGAPTISSSPAMP